ncbi:MAG TPA: adenosylmethionine--8-amino-7-oxononanoate transaminase [Polyangiaceae bacterium]
MDRATLVDLDRRFVWHPYTDIDAWETRGEPIVVARAKGARLFDVDGRSYLDGNASWWVAGLGHGHPRLLRVLREQSETLAHVALAGITHEPAAALAAELCAVAPPGLTHVFYTDNGSTAVEAAVKIAIQSQRQRGHEQRTRFVALDGAFHGDTVGAASLGGVEIFRRPFAGVLFDCVHAPVPEEGGHARAFEAISALLAKDGDRTAAVVVEPVVQGAAGMRVYDAGYLRELRGLCDRHGVLLVVDEVFSGYGRTGPMWASSLAGVSPDILCVGKTFAGGILPMGATLVTDAVYDAFRGGKERSFYYGHTFCGHPLGAALAREVLAIFRDEDVLGQVARKEPLIRRAFQRIGELPGVARVRSIGMIGAADLGGAGYLGGLGWQVYEEAKKRGAYLRPLGDTVYVSPPLTIDEADLASLLRILEESVRAVVRAT